MFHIYAQYFHPESLLERVRDVAFYRRPRTLFKGFKVPDWATSDKMNGWQVDAYSRGAWDQAMVEFESEYTPKQFFGQRQEPNPLQWIRLEQAGSGHSSRLFYNEVPKPTWFRYEGHLDNPDEVLYSFTKADQDQALVFGIDTTTEEGRVAFKKEYEALHQMAPEMVKMENLIYPHEIAPHVPNEAHFQRIWTYYREFGLKKAMNHVAAEGLVSSADVDLALKFISDRHHLSVSRYVKTKQGMRPDLENEEGFLAADRVFKAVGLDQVPLSILTAQSFEDQFWTTCEGVLELSEDDMRAHLPQLVEDESSKKRVEAFLNQNSQQIGSDQKLSLSE